MSNRYYGYLSTPIGLLEITCTKTKLVECNFVKSKNNTETDNSIIQKTLSQINEYFSKERKVFNLDLLLEGTVFQNKVWSILQSIPYGSTITYTELAKKVGNEKAIRAVGNANAKNPISIIIPCHRIIGNDGKLRGYGGGIEKKEWLINFEKRRL